MGSVRLRGPPPPKKKNEEEGGFPFSPLSPGLKRGQIRPCSPSLVRPGIAIGTLVEGSYVQQAFFFFLFLFFSASSEESGRLPPNRQLRLEGG